MENFLDLIHTRRSIRKYTAEPITPEEVEKLLRAAMISPTACNSQTWRFVVIDDHALLKKIPDIHPYASFAAEAPLAILVCGDSEAGRFPEFWPQDAAAATQTLMLAARAMNIGSVWCGIYPNDERVNAFASMFGLPAHIKAFGLVVLGKPAQPFSREDRYDPDKVHHNRW